MSMDGGTADLRFLTNKALCMSDYLAFIISKGKADLQIQRLGCDVNGLTG